MISATGEQGLAQERLSKIFLSNYLSLRPPDGVYNLKE